MAFQLSSLGIKDQTHITAGYKNPGKTKVLLKMRITVCGRVTLHPPQRHTHSPKVSSDNSFQPHQS